MKTYRREGTRILLTPPSLTLILRQRLDKVWGEVFTTFLTCTHWVAIPSKVSPTRFTSAARKKKQGYNMNVCQYNAKNIMHHHMHVDSTALLEYRELFHGFSKNKNPLLFNKEYVGIYQEGEIWVGIAVVMGHFADNMFYILSAACK